jgi:hypothetical protein
MDQAVATTIEVPAVHQAETDASAHLAEGTIVPAITGQLELTLANAEYLLNYAIEAGIEVDPDTIQRIIEAKRVGHAIWDSPDAGAMISAVTKLAGKLLPVTAETLRACRDDANDAISDYKRIVIWLASFIIPLSMISFIYTAISNSITADVNKANDLAVTLHQQLDPLAPTATSQSVLLGVVSEMQVFASTMRAIYSRSGQLSFFVGYTAYDPYAHDKPSETYGSMQLPPEGFKTIGEMQSTLNKLTGLYQKVRDYANDAQDRTRAIWGAFGACILPVLYALLGACAYVLRAFTEQTEKRTFAPSYATPARFIIAGIGGGVIGLFNNFMVDQGLTLSPLALAFLIGYAADIFFSLLAGTMQNLRGNKPR